MTNECTQLDVESREPSTTHSVELSLGRWWTGTKIRSPKKVQNYKYVICFNEMSHISANLILRKRCISRINIAQYLSTIWTFCYKNIVQYLFCQLAMLIFHLYYYLVYFIAFLERLRNSYVSHMNFIKWNQ